MRNFTSASISPHFILIYWSIDYCLTSRKQYFSYIQQLGRDEKFSLLQWPHCAYSLSKSTKEVFSVQGKLPSPNMLATMVWKPDNPPPPLSLRGLLLSAIRGLAEQLCGLVPWDPSPVPSILIKLVTTHCLFELYPFNWIDLPTDQDKKISFQEERQVKTMILLCQMRSMCSL